MTAFYVFLASWILLSIAGMLGLNWFRDRRRVARMALSILFLFTGVSHFTALRHDYLAMIPAPFPQEMAIIYLTGLLEIAGAIGLQVPRWRRLAGLGLILLLVAMFPANVNAALNQIPFRGGQPTPLALRFPVQLLFLAVLWWCVLGPPPALEGRIEKWLAGLVSGAIGQILPGLLLAVVLLGISGAVSTPLANAQSSDEPLWGDWIGGYELDDEWHFVEAHFERQGDDLRGSFDFRFDKNTAIYADSIILDESGEMLISLVRDGHRLQFSARQEDRQLFGAVTAAGRSGRLVLNRVHDLDMALFRPMIGNYQLDGRTILLFTMQDMNRFYYFDTEAQRQVRIYPLSDSLFYSEQNEEIEIVWGRDETSARLVWRTTDGVERTASRASFYSEEEVRYAHGQITLAGTLLLPSTPGPHPAIVLMHGTSPQNRDNFRMWGHYFAEKGIAALVYDKPGAFDSAHPSVNSYWENSVKDLADAAIAGVHYLQSRPEINPTQVGIWTFSNSSWAGPLAAANSEDVAFLISMAASGVAQRQADVFQDDLNNIGYYDYPAWAAQTSLDYLRFTREFSISAREWNLPIPAPFRDYYGQDFDPLTAWQDVTVPVLVMNGQKDTVVDPIDAVARIGSVLRQSGHLDYTLIIVPDADHMLQQTETGLRAEARGRRNHVFVPGVMDTMTDWVLARFDGQRTHLRKSSEILSPVPVQISAHFEPGGRYQLLPWYGKPLWQTGLLLLFVVVFAVSLVGIPLKALASLLGVRRQIVVPSRWSALRWVTSLLGLTALASLVLTWVQIVHLYSGAFFGFPRILNAVPILGVATSILVIALAATFVHRWWQGERSLPHAIFTMIGLLFIWYLSYWHVLV